MESLRVILRDFTDETVTIFVLFLMFIMGIMMIYWLYNRRKFHRLTHQIPANIVKNYLDSIIQNSTALKSSLFRGGGLEVGSGIPSVLPVGNLGSGGVTSGVGIEELNQKNAEIAMLTRQVSEKIKLVSELEQKLSQSGDAGEVAKLKTEIAKLQEQLKAAMSATGGDEVLKTNLVTVTKERDDLKERLQEYEIIEEDLANLKRLQQENEQLKKSLADAGMAIPAVAAVAAAPKAAKAEPVKEPEPIEEVVAEAEAELPPDEPVEAPVEEVVAEAAPPAEEEEIPMPTAGAGEQKSAEELLSEFEKMLG